MKYIDEEKILKTLDDAKNATDEKVESILNKSLSLQRLSIHETAVLLQADDEKNVNKIFHAAKLVKKRIYGNRIVLFAPLYISNYCRNDCLYCAFRASNRVVKRKFLTYDEILEQTQIILKMGHKRILLVAGEAPPPKTSLIDYYLDAIKAVYSANYENSKIRRVNINAAPLSVEEFRQLKKAGIGTYQIFQETYHEDTYKKMHPSGPKKDFDNRIDAVDRAFKAGIDDVGIGVLFGLYDYKFETLALLMHIEALEKKFNVGPHTISVPRIEPAEGVNFKPDYELSDKEFKKLVSILRLAVPYTGMILSTRETPSMRDELFDLGISQASAASKTSPGGYKEQETTAQFFLGDSRSLDEIMETLIKKGYLPSFCTACYRSGRTGETFMNLAKPGTIKGKCTMNALITLKEYLDDFASEEVRKAGYDLIQKEKEKLSSSEQLALSKFYEEIEKGLRDKYV